MKKAVLFLFVFTLSFFSLYAQNYTVDPSQSEVVIKGTSTIHDWESVAEKFTGAARIIIKDDTLRSIEDLSFIVTVKEIQSGKGGMDKKIRGALDEKNHPAISFDLTEITDIKGDSVFATGTLTVAGFTNSIKMKAAWKILDNEVVAFEGVQPIKMTDYKIDPPTAVFGTIKAGDDITVEFKVKFIQ